MVFGSIIVNRLFAIWNYRSRAMLGYQRKYFITEIIQFFHKGIFAERINTATETPVIFGGLFLRPLSPIPAGHNQFPRRIRK